MLALLAAATLSSTQLGAWGVETLDLIRRDFYLPEKLLYAEETGSKEPCFNWGTGVMLSALNAAAKLDSKYLPWLEEYASASRIYWNDKGPVPGYDVLPAPKPVDRYYDDNEWMALQLIEAYELTKSEKYLTWARETVDYVLSGEDQKLGGGIYWRESDKKSKNTCSNGPGVAACTALYRHTKDSRLLVSAIRIYGWTKKRLQDPQDHLFWDSVNLSGKVDKMKWSYNTALMIRSAADLYSLTGNPQYKKDLVQMQSASAKKWLRGAIKDEGRFAHLLLDAWIFQRTHVPYPGQERADERAFVAPLTFLHDIARSPTGFYGSRFYQPSAVTQSKWALIDQASVARAYFSAALYLRAHSN
ncbi:MAG TPA: glycoside hydrolase family 76 protein [Fimbriimonas sp.]|nr:glycoside hydrolase family 76 protein [Fimbriimonas sp.]